MEERSLNTVLSAYDKPELQDLANILGSTLSTHLRKSQMVSELQSYIRSYPQQWMSHLMERDVKLLRDLVRNGPEKVLYQDFADYPSLLEVTGLVQYDDSDDNYHKVWISREMFEIVSPEVDSVIHSLERNGQFKLERVALGYLNLYGVIPTDAFVDIMMDWFKENVGGSNRHLSKLLSTTPIVKLYRYSDKWGDYLCSPCVPDIDELMTQLQDFDGEYAVFHDFDALQAGAGAPYFTVGLKTIEGMRLEQMFRRIGYEGFDLVKAVHDTWMESQFTSGPRPELYDTVFDSPLYGTLDSAALESFFGIVSDYADSVPKWCLKGNSAKSTGKCLCDRNAWRQDMPAAPSEPQGDYPHWSMPEPPVRAHGFTIPHVAPNDPCPCGSGLRYCRCHGKYLN